MIRIVLEIVSLLLLPTIGYVAWTAFRRRDWPGIFVILGEAPLIRLFAAGVFLMLATLILFSSRTGNRPDEPYQPPSFEDGKLNPGHKVGNGS